MLYSSRVATILVTVLSEYTQYIQETTSVHALHAHNVRTGFCDVSQYITDQCGYKSYQQGTMDESYYNTHNSYCMCMC